MKTWKKWLIGVAALILVVVLYAGFAMKFLQGSALRAFENGRLDHADYWSDQPSILSAGYGFDNIIGLPSIDEQTVRAAGGAWFSSASCTSGATPDDGTHTSAAPASVIPTGYEGYADHDDGLPVVFSWPLASETVDPTDFQFTLNTGATVFGHAAGMNPNWENNERNTVVLFGDFGNRMRADEPGAIFPVELEIVADDTPLTLVGPGGQEVSAVGMTWSTDTTPYDSGPKLVGAKLNFTGAEAHGEGGAAIVERQGGALPNDEFSLYGDQGDFRLRVLTTGGFSPDGVTGLQPDDFEQFFRLRARGPDGTTVLIDRTHTDYAVAGGTLRVIGLSDLGKVANPDDGVFYDDCYQEDRDNYIDIILAGDAAAARSIESVEIPSLDGGYHAFYNPGGPGPEPFPEVRYTAPGPPDLEPVILALDDPMRISRDEQRADPSLLQVTAALVAVLAAVGTATYLLYRRLRTRSTTPARATPDSANSSGTETIETR